MRFWTQRKDLMLDLLRFISASPLRDRLILHGGAVLNFVYGSQRLTRDLDFVASPDALPRPDEMRAAIPDIEIRFIDRESVPPFMRAAKRIRCGGLWLSVPIEIAGVRVGNVSETEAAPGVRILVETPAEIFTDKIVSCLARMEERGSIKPQDLFDIAFLRREHPVIQVAPKSIDSRMKDYGKQWNAGIIRRVLAWLREGEAVWAVRDALKKTGTKDYPDGGEEAVDGLPEGLKPESIVAVNAEVFHDLLSAY